MNNSKFALKMVLSAASVALIIPSAALAAATPALVTAGAYGVLSNTFTNVSAGTTINGDIGFTTGPAVTPAGTQTNYGSASPYSAAGSDQGAALSALNSELCTYTFPPGAVNLSTDTTHGAIGVYTPGVYCSSGAMNVGGPLLLSGSGTYIFRPVGALTSTAGAVVTLTGGSTCDVFWTPSGATTLAANTTFLGTVIDDAGITIGANTNWLGRALSFGGTVTTDTDTINRPTCSAAVVTPPAAASISTRGFSGQFATPQSVTQNSPAIALQTTTATTTTASSIATSTVSATPAVVGISSSTIPGLPNTGLPPTGWGTEEAVASFFALALFGLLTRRVLRA